MTPRIKPEEVRDIAVCLTYMSEHQGEQDMFGGVLSKYNETVKSKAKEYWNRMIELGKIDSIKKCIEESRHKAERLVDVNTVKHTDARDVGAEWIYLQAIRELEIDKFLALKGWTEHKINTTLAHLITRTISILARNTADPDSLPNMIDALASKIQLPWQSLEGVFHEQEVQGTL